MKQEKKKKTVKGIKEKNIKKENGRMKSERKYAQKKDMTTNTIKK